MRRGPSAVRIRRIWAGICVHSGFHFGWVKPYHPETRVRLDDWWFCIGPLALIFDEEWT